MKWEQIKLPDDLRQWAQEMAASPVALACFNSCMHHLADQIKKVIQTSDLEYPLSMMPGMSQVTLRDGQIIDCYLASFRLEDTGQEFDYLFEMLPGTEQFKRAWYADPAMSVMSATLQ